MKKQFLAGLFLSVTLSVLHAEADLFPPQYTFSFLTNPVSHFVNYIAPGVDDDINTQFLFWDVEFQWFVNNYFNISLQPVFMYGSDNYYIITSHDDGGYTEHEGYIKEYQAGATIGMLFRPFGGGLKGMYVGLYPSIGWKLLAPENLPEEVQEPSTNYLLLGLVSGIGHQWIFRRGFTLTLGGGIGYAWDIPLGETGGSYAGFDVVNFLPFGLRLNHIVLFPNLKLGCSF